jgi:hypothetical protein
MIFSRLVAVACIALAATACTPTATRTAVDPVDPVDIEVTTADGDTADGDVADSAVAATDDPMVCKRVIPTGTRVAQRTCMRQSEFDKAKKDGQEMLDEVQRRGVIDTVRRE